MVLKKQSSCNCLLLCHTNAQVIFSTLYYKRRNLIAKHQLFIYGWKWSNDIQQTAINVALYLISDTHKHVVRIYRITATSTHVMERQRSYFHSVEPKYSRKCTILATDTYHTKFNTKQKRPTPYPRCGKLWFEAFGT